MIESASEQRKRFLAELEEVVRHFGGTLMAEVIPPGVLADEVGSSVREHFEKLSRAAGEVLTGLSEAHSDSNRTAMKEKQKAFEMKLDHARTGVKMQLQNQAAELDGIHKEEMEKKIASLLDGGDAALKKAYMRAEAATAELAELKLKFEGVESGFNMASSRLKVAEGRVSTLEAEAARSDATLTACHTMLEKEQKELKLLRVEGASVDAILTDVLDAYEARRNALATAQAALKAALEAQGIKVGPSMGLDEQMGALIAKMEEEQAGRKQAIQTINDMERAAEVLTEERDELKSHRDRLQIERDDLAAKLAGAEGKAKAIQDRLQKQLDEVTARANSLESELSSTKATLESTSAENARLKHYQETIDEREREWKEKLTRQQQEVDEARALQKAAEDAKEELEDRLAKLQAQFDASTAQIAKLEKTIKKNNEDIAKHQSLMDEMKQKVQDTQNSMNSLLAQGNGSEAQTEYWKGESAKQAKEVDRLNKKQDELKGLLDEVSKKLKFKIEANDDLESRLVAVLKEFSICKEEMNRCQKALDKTATAFKLMKGNKSELEGQLGTVIEDYAVCKVELQKFKARLGHTLGDLAGKIAENATLEEQLTALIDDHEGCKRQTFAVLSPLESAKHVGKARKSMKIDTPLAEMLAKLIDQNYAAQHAKDVSERAEAKAHAETAKLRVRVEQLEAMANEQARVAAESQKSERSKLVRSALSSLQSLRQHVAVELTGEREVPREEPIHEEFAFNTFKNRWGVVSDGVFDQIVVKVEGKADKAGGPKRPTEPRHGAISRPQTSAAASPSPRRPSLMRPSTVQSPDTLTRALSPPRSPAIYSPNATLPRLRDAPRVMTASADDRRDYLNLDFSSSSGIEPSFRPHPVRPPTDSPNPKLHGAALSRGGAAVSRGSLSAREATSRGPGVEQLGPEATIFPEAKSAPLSARLARDSNRGRAQSIEN